MPPSKKMKGRLSFRVETASKERLSGIIRSRYPGLDESDVLREIVEVATELLERRELKLFTGHPEPAESPPPGRSAVMPRGKAKTARERPRSPNQRV